MSILTLLLLVPIAGAVVVGLAGRVGNNAVRWTALITVLLDLALSVALGFAVREGPVSVQHPWVPQFGVSYFLEADGLAAILVLLTTLIGVISVIISWDEIKEKVAGFHIWILLLQTGILVVFLARDLMLFYFGWELMLIPMFFLIGVWGHEDKLRSAFKFFLFTFTGSIFMLAALLYVYYRHGIQSGVFTFSLPALLQTTLSADEQWWVFLGLFIGFAVKVPLFPLHTWLPDAHTQAPTAGSLVLAGLLLKTGVYGLLRIAMPLAAKAAVAFAPFVIALSLFGIFYGAIVAFSQRDFKRLVAYSSISHLGFVVLGLFVGNAAGYQGAVLQMVNHGLATGGLFLLAGIIQHRAHTRNLEMFGGLWKQVPGMGGFLLFFAFASLGIPGTGNFIGELYVIAGAFQHDRVLGAITALGVLFAAAYSLRIFVATMHGPASTTFRKFADLNRRETAALAVLVVSLVAVGIFPRVVTRPLYFPPDALVPQQGRLPDILSGMTFESHGGPVPSVPGDVPMAPQNREVAL